MAKLVYWSHLGDDTNDGLSSANPVRTMTQALSVAASGDRIVMAPGVYPTSLTSGTGALRITKSVMITPQQRGTVTFDFEGALPTVAHIETENNVTVVFRGIHFRNMGPGKYALYRVTSGSSSFQSYAIDCVFYQRDGASNTGRGVVGGLAQAMNAERCSFYNLEEGCNDSEVYSCYFNSVTNEFADTSVADYNAYSGNVETNGIDTDAANSDPGFVDAAGEDFRLDQTDATAFSLFMTGGQYAGRVGAPGAQGPWWDARWAQSRWMAPDPTPSTEMHGSWINDPDYQDPGGSGSTGTIIEGSGDFEPVIDLATNPDALSGRLLSPVIDWGGGTTIDVETFSLGRFLDLPAGAAIDTDLYLPEEIEYRQSGTAFDPDDDPVAGPAWTTFAFDDVLNLNNRYQQFRVTFQTAHANS